jgi:hypothetical protein
VSLCAVFGNLVLAFGGVEGKGVHTIYAIFNTIIVSVIGFYGFYHGYKVRRSHRCAFFWLWAGLASLPRSSPSVSVTPLPLVHRGHQTPTQR